MKWAIIRRIMGVEVRREFELRDVVGMGVDDRGSYYVRLRGGLALSLTRRQAEALSRAGGRPMPELSEADKQRECWRRDARRLLHD